MSQEKPIDLEGLLDTASNLEDKPVVFSDEEQSSEETEAVLDPDFVDDPDSEFLSQESLDSIIEEEGEAN